MAYHNNDREAVEKLIAEIYAGKLHPRAAAGLAALLNLQLRVVEATDFERRLASVEQLLAKEDAASALQGNRVGPRPGFRKSPI